MLPFCNFYLYEICERTDFPAILINQFRILRSFKQRSKFSTWSLGQFIVVPTSLIRWIMPDSKLDECFIWLKVFIWIFTDARDVFLIRLAFFPPCLHIIFRFRFLNTSQQGLVFNYNFDKFLFPVIFIKTKLLAAASRKHT